MTMRPAIPFSNNGFMPITRLVAAVGALVVGATAAVEAGETFGAESFTLDNGLQVVVVSNHRAPVVHHAVWYRVGAADERPGESGIAHMLEHMMFKGTATVPAGEFSKIVSRNGGTDNAFTSHDYTGYFQNIARDRLEIVMEMEADRMVNLAFSDKDFVTERDVVLEERRSRTDNRPRALFSEQVNAAQYLSHPYRLPIIGWEHEIRGFDRDAALAFYRTYYVPNNAVLMVIGDITAAELRPLAERYFAALKSRPVPERARPQEPPQRAARRVEMTDARVANPEWSRGYIAPSYRTDPDGHALALDVLTEILGGGTTSRLYQALVVEQKIADQAGANYNGGTYDPTRFAIFAMPRAGADPAAVEAAVEAEIARLITDGVGDDELARVKFGIKARTIYARDSLYMIARIFGGALTAGLTVDDVESWPRRIEAVTAAQVVAAAKAMLRPEHAVTGLLLPAAASPDSPPS